MSKNQPVKQACLFLGLTLVFSFFVFWGPLAFFGVPAISFVGDSHGPAWAIVLYVLGGFVPSLLAVILTWIYEGVNGLRSMGRRMIRFGIGWKWYLAAVLVVLAGTAGQLALTYILGNVFDLSLFWKQLGSFLPLLILGPLSEELGWRGFALDRLQTRWNALTSSLIIGVVWGFWHLPLFYMAGTSQNVLGIPFAGFVLGVAATSILYTWLHNNTGGSLWTAIFLHWIYTYAAQVIATGATRSVLYNWLEYTPYVLIAIAVVVIWKPARLAQIAPTEPPAK